MTIEDPTLSTLASYDMSGVEAFMGSILLASTILLEMLNSVIPKDKSCISQRATRTPEKAFENVVESQGNLNYVYIEHGGQKLRVHYVDQGHRNGKVLLCLHGEPFWSQSYRRLIPYLVNSGKYRVIAPDFVGFGRSDKLVDWRAYSLSLHEDTIVQLMKQLNVVENVTLIGHNWGFLAGIHVLRKHPEWFDSLIILNTNNLPDGEVDKSRFPRTGSLFLKYLQYDAFFLAFRSAMFLLKHSFPLPIMFSAFNTRYTAKEKHDFMAPFRRTEDLGGFVAFPLMVPVRPDDNYVADFREARIFLAEKWKKPTLIMYSDTALFPFLQTGDFVVGNRRHFFQKLIPSAEVVPRIPGGHLIQYDNPTAVSHYISDFITRHEI